jgi:hypothetical protein
MKSKADIIRSTLTGLRVLDIGGCGFGADNAYERDLRDAWSCVASRTTVDRSPRADVQADLNCGLPDFSKQEWDITTLFDVLEHLESPVKILRAVPTSRVLISLPNVLSPFCRRMERRDGLHLYSFTDYTAATLLKAAGWRVERIYYTFGKWSFISRCINVAGSIVPVFTGTGIMIHGERV